jgi:uncharacterized sulfatase
VVYVTDNGWIQQADQAGYAPRSKRSPNDGGLRTPIIVKWPGVIAAGQDDTTPVLSLDLIPTILEACGLESRASLPGISLLHGPPSSRDAIFGEIFAHDAVDIHDPASSLQYRWMIAGDWKLILPAGQRESAELYQITRDPWEQKDLARAQPDRVQEMVDAINGWWSP